MPAISVVVPLYNLRGPLTRAVESIMAQTFPDWECIIVDDGSTDGGGELADRLAAQDRRVHVLHQANAGLSNALNTGFNLASGQAFMILSADDKLMPTYMEKLHKKMMRDEADIVSCDMDATGQIIKCMPGSQERLRDGNCHHYAALYRRWLFEKSGGYKPIMNPSWEDYEFWVSCAELRARWAHVSEPLFIYYPSPNGRSVEAFGKDGLLCGLMQGYHPATFGTGRGVVAVIIPCYQYEQYLGEAVQSAAEQTYPHVRIVIVDDASPTWTDGYSDTDTCHVVRHTENRGLGAARNSGLQWAIQQWNPEYFIALDADDTLHPEFIMRTMAATEETRWVYTDVKMIGDAWHEMAMPDWDCMMVGRKHQHPCTFLGQTKMFVDVHYDRGYGYDEGQTMRIGYEDLEFALACIERGWVGYRQPGAWFNYRFHNNGSMRTRAHPHRDELVRYIASRHPWAYSVEGLKMTCKSCGGKKPMPAKNNQVAVANLGEVPLGEPLRVTYTGTGDGMKTKTGASGRTYRYSAQKRVFIIDARDNFLFDKGPFQIARVTRVVPPPPPAVTVIEPLPVAPVPPPPPITAAEALLPDLGPAAMPNNEPMPAPAEPVPTLDPNTRQGKMMALPHLTPRHVGQLWMAGKRSIKAIAEMTPEGLEKIVDLPRKECQEIVRHARALRKLS